MNTISTQQKMDWLKSIGYMVVSVGNLIVAYDKNGEGVMTFDEYKMALKAGEQLHEITNWRNISHKRFVNIINAFELVPEVKLNEAHALHLTNKLS